MLAKASRCDATNELRLTFVQDGADVSGYYQCAIGNTACRDIQDAGPVSGGYLSGNRLKFQVDFPNDGSDCVFHGKLRAASASGAYACYAGGKEVESGHWHVSKKSSIVPPRPVLFE